MGKFDGVLICSDIDGTFQRKPEIGVVNGEAVKYFINNGGKFTFATGRSVPTLKASGLCSYINAPAINLSGGLIYDYAEDKVISESRLGFDVDEILQQLGTYVEENTNIYIFNGIDKKDTIVCNKKDITEKIQSIFPIKLYFEFKTEKEADKFKSAALECSLLDDYYISKSWVGGVEIDCKNKTKGHGLCFLKKHLGNIHTTVGVGNYENDLPLIEYADIGVAVEDSVECLKESADIIVNKCSEYSIKNLIEILESRL